MLIRHFATKVKPISFGPPSITTRHPSDVIAYLANDRALSHTPNGLIFFQEFLNAFDYRQHDLSNKIGLSIQHRSLFNFANKCFLIKANTQDVTRQATIQHVKLMADMLGITVPTTKLSFGIFYPDHYSELMQRLHKKIETDFGKTVEVRPFSDDDLIQIRFLKNTITLLATAKKMDPEDYIHEYPEILLHHAGVRGNRLT